MAKFIGKHSDVTEKVLAAFYKVHNELGYGFKEEIYKNAMALELESMGMKVEKEKEIVVYYHGKVVGLLRVDLLVNDVVIIELKATSQPLLEYAAQLLSYLKATLIEVGLLLNFGPKPAFERKVYDNDRKGSLSWIKP